MRVVIQRVKSASVTVDGGIISQIKTGLLILAGIEVSDTVNDLEWIAKKITGLRIFDDADKIPNRSVIDAGADMLVVSQFTLHASTKKGNRPGYSNAAKGSLAETMISQLVLLLSQISSKDVYIGKFGADMQVMLVNDGPLTIIIDSKLRE